MMDMQQAMKRLDQVFSTLGIDPAKIAAHYISTNRKKVTVRLSTLTGLSGVTNVRCNIEKSIPARVARFLEKELDDRILWVMAHFSMLDQTTMVLTSASNILVSDRERAKGQDVLYHAARYLSEDLAEAKSRARRIVARLLKHGIDGVLGQYSPHDKSIDLFYYPIWLVSQTHMVRYEDVLFVVLTHEFAHAYSHLGVDGDGHSWSVNKFVATDLRVIEGLAEYFSEFMSREESCKVSGYGVGPIEAYEALLSDAASEYHVHRQWPSIKSNKEIEVVRAAMIEERSVGDGIYDRFLHRISEAMNRFGRKRERPL